MTSATIYQEIAQRTGGDIYLGVVGPVRTGKSTLIKRFLEQLVLPNIDDPYRRQRAQDELPQSGSGKTIMTAEPKFIPEEAVTVSPDGTAQLSVRMIDSVGYLIPNAAGAMEDGQTRMVTTPWADHEIPLTEAAELGTKKVIAEHCTAGIVVTTDGSVTEFDRADYLEAERRAITDLQATGKPFVVIINSAAPEGSEAQALCQSLTAEYHAVCLCMNCMTMELPQIQTLLQTLLYAFPVSELQFFLPGWFNALELEHGMKRTLYDAMRGLAGEISRISQAEPALQELLQLPSVQACRIRSIDLGRGVVTCELQCPEALFYQVLGEKSGFPIENDAQLMQLLEDLAKTKAAYDKVADALEQVQATGYGVVMPTAEEMELQPPEIVRKGGSYAVRIKASAPSIHMLRADLQTEINPMVGDEKQSQDLVQYLLDACDGDPKKLWQSNLFGRSVYDLVSDGLQTKLRHMPETARYKFKSALTRILNDGSGGLICILL